MKNSKYILFLLLATSSANTAEMLTLEKCVELATTTTTTVLQAQNLDTAAGAELIKGYAQFLPNLQAFATFGYEGGHKFFATTTPTVLTTSTYGLSYQISTTLNLFNGLADFAALQSAINRREYATLTLRRAKQLITLDVTQSFLQVMLDRKLIAIAQSAYDASKSQLELIKQKLDLGSENMANYASQQAQTQTNQTLLLSAQNQAKTDVLLLLQKLRLDVTKDYELQEPAQSESAALDSQYASEVNLIALALENRADLRGARRTASAAEWGITSAQAGFWPTLYTQFALNSNARTLLTQTDGVNNYVPPTQKSLFTQLGAHHYFDLTINLSWNIFDQWTTPQNVARATATARNARIDAFDRERQVEVEVRRGLLDYQTAARLVESTTLGASAAQQAYNLVRGRFDEGISNFTDVQVSQATLVSAQSAKAQAVINFVLKQRALETALGR
jgi:outer membrane protein